MGAKIIHYQPDTLWYKHLSPPLTSLTVEMSTKMAPGGCSSFGLPHITFLSFVICFISHAITPSLLHSMSLDKSPRTSWLCDAAPTYRPEQVPCLFKFSEISCSREDDMKGQFHAPPSDTQTYSIPSLS